MRSGRQLTVATILSVLLLGAVALPTAATETDLAAAAYRPDGRVRLQSLTSSDGPPIVYSKPWLGNNIYNSTGYKQTARATLGGSSFSGWLRWTFGVSAQNDGTSTDRFRVHATGMALSGWTVRYFHGSTNISAAVRDGTFTTPMLAPGEQYLIEARVRVEFGSDVTLATLRRLVTLTSIHNPNKVDTVKFVVRFEACGC